MAPQRAVDIVAAWLQLYGWRGFGCADTDAGPRHRQSAADMMPGYRSRTFDTARSVRPVWILSLLVGLFVAVAMADSPRPSSHRTWLVQEARRADTFPTEYYRKQLASSREGTRRRALTALVKKFSGHPEVPGLLIGAIARKGYGAYLHESTRPYLAAVADHYDPDRPTWTEGFLGWLAGGWRAGDESGPTDGEETDEPSPPAD